MDGADGSMEARLGRVEMRAAEGLEATRRLQAVLKAAHKAADLGDLRSLRRAIDQAEDALGEAAEAVNMLSDAWEMDEEREVALLGSPEYTQEILDEARRAGLRIFPQGDALAAYPALVRIMPAQRQVRVDRKALRIVRPSRLVRHLREIQERPAKLKADTFLEAIFAAYRLLTPGGGMTRLVDIHRALTLLPSARADYTLQEFARDVYLLDASGSRRTKSGHVMRLEPGATGSKHRANLLVVVGREGDERTYQGVAFHEER